MIKERKEPNTRVVGKEFSPLIIRRYSMPCLMFVGIITDDDLDDLDEHVKEYFTDNELPNSIQGMRNFAGGISDYLTRFYPKTEGIAIVIQADKMTISSLNGDFMNHESCRIEFYGLLNFATGV